MEKVNAFWAKARSLLRKRSKPFRQEIKTFLGVVKKVSPFQKGETFNTGKQPVQTQKNLPRQRRGNSQITK